MSGENSNSDDSEDDLINNVSRNVMILVNDYFPEYAVALDKLGKRLGRPLKGVLLVDKNLNRQNTEQPIPFEVIVCDFSNINELRATLNRFEKSLLLISCSSERSQMDFKLLAPLVPYVLTPTESSLDWATHKGMMREMLGSYDKSLVPEVQQVSSADDIEIENVLSHMDFPMIVKPTGLAGSLLVTKVDNEEELREALSNSFTVIEDVYKRDKGRGKPSMLVEEFIVGQIYTVDAYVNERGKVWTMPLLRTTTARQAGREGFYIYQEDSYVGLSDDAISECQKTAVKAVHAIGLRSSVAHIELFDTEDGWKIIELGPRPGGQRQEVYKLTYDMDHAYNELLVKVGLAPEIKSKYLRHSSAMAIYAEEEGEIEAVEGVEEVRQHPSVYNMLQHAKPGDSAQSSINGGKRLAEGVLFNEAREQLADDLVMARETVKFVTKKTSPKSERLLVK